MASLNRYIARENNQLGQEAVMHVVMVKLTVEF